MDDFVRRDDFKDFRADLRMLHEQQRRETAQGFVEIKQRLDVANGRTSKNEDRIAALERTFDRCPLLNTDATHALNVLRQPPTAASGIGFDTAAFGWKALLAGFSILGAAYVALGKLVDFVVTVVLKHGS